MTVHGVTAGCKVAPQWLRAGPGRRRGAGACSGVLRFAQRARVPATASAVPQLVPTECLSELEDGARIQKWIWVTIKLVAYKYRQYKSRIQNMIVFASPALSLGMEVRNRMQFFHSRTTLYRLIFVIVPWDSGKPKQI